MDCVDEKLDWDQLAEPPTCQPIGFPLHVELHRSMDPGGLLVIGYGLELLHRRGRDDVLMSS